MPRNIGHDLLDVPFPRDDPQHGARHRRGLAGPGPERHLLAQMMTGRYEVEVEDEEGNVTKEEREAFVTYGDEQLSLMELGFTPTFYQFVNTIIEVKISLSMSTERSYSGSSTSPPALRCRCTRRRRG